jgi:hypothetical protein
MRGVLCKSLKQRGLVLCVAFAASALLMPSCGKSRKPVYPVHGTILDNEGKPAVGAIIIFHSTDTSDASSTNPAAVVAEDGSFAITTYETGDGAPEGEYVATIEWRKRQGFGGPEGPDLLGGQLSDKATSQLRFKVEKQPDNVLEPIKLP